MTGFKYVGTSEVNSSTVTYGGGTPNYHLVAIIKGNPDNLPTPTYSVAPQKQRMKISKDTWLYVAIVVITLVISYYVGGNHFSVSYLPNK